MSIDVAVPRGGRPAPGMISMREAAELLGMNSTSVRDLVKDGSGVGRDFEAAVAKKFFDGSTDKLYSAASAWAAANPEHSHEPTIERVQNHDAADMDALERVILGTQPWWPSGTTPEQIERVSTIARDERFKVKDPSVLSETFWFGRLEEIARDVTGRTRSVHQREAVEDPAEQDARELAEERARRKAAREARTKGSQ